MSHDKAPYKSTYTLLYYIRQGSHHVVHGVALVQISDAGLKRAARGSLKYRTQTRMWANAQRDGRPAYYRWCPLLNDAVWLTHAHY